MHTTSKPLHPVDSQASLGHLLGDLITHTTALVKGEVALVRSEVRSKVTAYCTAALMTVLGMGFALLACMAFLTAGIVGLAAYVGFAMSALICGAVLAIPAAVLLSKGMGHFKRLSN